MAHRFQRHYSRDEAQALLPNLRRWLMELREAHGAILAGEQQLAPLISQGADAGGPLVNELCRALARFHSALGQFAQRQILIKDVERGLVDFPAFIEGREVFLCWEESEDGVSFWHELDTGYAGRQPLSEDE
jgi:hypothetical protein